MPRESACPDRIRPVRTLLEKQRDNLLAFAVNWTVNWRPWPKRGRSVDDRPGGLAGAIPADVGPKRWRREAVLDDATRALSRRVRRRAGALRSGVRASSLVENLNSRLRSYFFLRRQLGKDYLTLLQFFLNHRRYLRSEDPSRVGKSPAELLTGQPHAHWLELLGYTRFSRNWSPSTAARDSRKPAPTRDRSGCALRSRVLPEKGVLEPCPF